MLGVCPNAWQTYGCEWIIGYLWRWTNLLERLALLGLALMLLHTVVVTVRVSYCYYSARHAEVTDANSQAFQRNRRELVAKLNLSVDSLKSIASTAPYLGLAGTCLGIMGMFRAFEGSTHDFFVIVITEIEAAFISTAAGILVAVPAIVSYYCLRALVDSLEPTCRQPRAVQKAPLAARFSKIPFAVIAAPVLVLCIAGFMTFSSFRISKGLVVGIASAHCGYDGDRVIALRITDAGRLFLNAEQEDWNSVATRLSEIYLLRVDRTLYLFVEDGVPFQVVADALDVVETNRPKIRVRLVTPSMKTHCPEFPHPSR
jgi:biopolymer transport protein ExbB